MSIFQHDIYVPLIIEVPEKSDNVRMSESPLDLQLLLHLRKEIKFFELGLLDELQCHSLARVYFDCTKNFAELPIPDRLDTFEVIHRPCLLPLLIRRLSHQGLVIGEVVICGLHLFIF